MFEKIKERFVRFKEDLMKRIEKNSFKQELTWTDKEGNTFSDLVYLKKSRIPIIGDWTRIYLPVNPETMKLNKMNFFFGGKGNLIKLLIYLGIVAVFFLAYWEISSQYNYLRNLPCVINCIENLRLR